MIDELIDKLSRENAKLKEESRKARTKGWIEAIDHILSLIENMTETEELRRLTKKIYNKRIIIIMEFSENEKNRE